MEEYKYTGTVQVIQRTAQGVFVKSVNNSNNYWWVTNEDWKNHYEKV